jgi:O-antigen/teichoic acid export membrane protein
MIKETFRSLFSKGSFTQDVAIVSSGKVFVAIIGFLFIPVLSRIYAPEAYGLFSIYHAVVTLLVTFSNLSYNSALVIVKDEKSFYNLFILSSLLTVFSSFAIFLILLVGEDLISSQFDLQFNPSLLFLIPLGIFLNGGIGVFTPWNVRRKQYTFSTAVSASHNLLIRIFNLIYGLITVNNLLGLIIGNQFGRFLALFAYFQKNISKEKKVLKEHISIRNIIQVAKKFK